MPSNRLAAGLAALLCAAPAPASAYVCSRVATNTGSDNGPSLSWFSRSVVFTLFAAGTQDVQGTQELGALRASFTAWEDLTVPPQESCTATGTTDLTFTEAAALGSEDRVGYDFLNPASTQNLLIFRDQAWPTVGQAATTIALTTTTYNAVTGEILDADIEFNSAHFNFTITDSGARTDLANTAVHEIGHVLGLAHSQDVESTMFASAPDGETKKRDLACDDKRAMLFKYPAAQANGYCDPPKSSCGMCAPPAALTSVPAIKVTDSEADSTGGCASTGPHAEALFAALLAITLARRRPW